MAAALEVFGSVSDTISVESFFSSFLPPAATTTTVRLWAALGNNSNTDTGGNLPTINLWDGVGGFIGSSEDVIDNIAPGEFYDYSIESWDPSNNRATDYIAISALESNDICISALAITQPNGDQFVVYGDVPAYCEAQWYYSNQVFGSGAFTPRCVWITSQPSPKRKYQGFGMHIRDFGYSDNLLSQYKENKASCCHAQPRFSMYTNISQKDSIPWFSPPLQLNADHTDIDPDSIPTAPSERASNVYFLNLFGHSTGDVGDRNASGASAPLTKPSNALAPSPRKRRHKRQVSDVSDSAFMADQLIVSNINSHSAQYLCTDDNSAGPDFISLVEGYYCEMDAKMLYPLCSTGLNSTACFNTTTNSLMQMTAPNTTYSWAGNTFVAAEPIPSKSYSSVIQWN